MDRTRVRVAQDGAMSEAPDQEFWEDTAYVVVYLYRYWDPAVEQLVVSHERATLHAIKSGLGSPMTETGIKVRRTDLDVHGRYHPSTVDRAQG